jgi:hypothetical protein
VSFLICLENRVLVLFAGWRQLLEQLQAVPRALVWDREGAIGRWRGGRSELTGECPAFRRTLGAKVLVCRPAEGRCRLRRSDVQRWDC